MSWELVVAWLMRFLHIGSAMAAVGAPFFVRFALMPAAAKSLDDASHQKLREAINARWRHIVYLLITLFLITGFYNFLVPTRAPDGHLLTARWKDFSPADKQNYHMLMGIKILAAFGIFFLASALAGRTATFAPVRKNAKGFIGILLVLATVVLLCATMLRYTPSRSSPVAPIPSEVLK